MYITNNTYDELNEVLRLCFQMNSFCDNIAYNLGHNKMVGTEPIFHEHFAHVFPQLADVISELMLKMEARPIRKALTEDSTEYKNNLDMFKELKSKTDSFRKSIIKLINVSEKNNDYEIKINMEEFLSNFMKYIDQVNIWERKALEYNDDIKKFDNDFKDFTIV